MDIGVGRRVAKASTLPLQTSAPLWLCPSRTGAATLLQKVWRGRAARKLAAVLRALPGGPRRGPAEAAGRCADTALLPRTPAEANGQAGHEHGSAGGRCGTGHTCVKTREVRAAGHRSFHIQTCCSLRCSFRTRKSRGLCPQASAAQHPGDAAQRRRHSGTLVAPPSTMKLPPFIPPPEIPLPCPLSPPSSLRQFLRPLVSLVPAAGTHLGGGHQRGARQVPRVGRTHPLCKGVWGGTQRRRMQSIRTGGYDLGG